MAEPLYRWSTDDGVFEVLGTPDDWYVEFAAWMTDGTLEPMQAAGRPDVAWPAIEEVLRLARERDALRAELAVVKRHLDEERRRV